MNKVIFIAFFLFFSEKDIEKIEDAEVLFYEGLYESALESYSSILKTSLGKRMKNELRYRIGECYFNMGMYEKALKIFKKLEESTKNTYLYPEVLYALGVVHLALGHREDAKRYLIEKMKEFPGYLSDLRIREGQGIYYFTEGIYETAYDKLKSAISGVGIFYKGEALARLGRPIDALKEFKRIQILYPYTPLAEYASYKAADAMFINEDYTGALNLFMKFIENYGTSKLVDYAKYKIGVCYLHLGDISKAISYFIPLFGHPDEILSAHAYLMAGMAMKRLGKYQDAIKYLLKAAFDFPFIGVAPYAHMELGKTYMEAGNTEQAVITYKQLANAYNSGEYMGIGDYLTASILYKEGRILEAQYQLENLIKYVVSSPIVLPSYSLLLKCMIDTRQFKEAILVGENFLKEDVLKLDGIDNEYFEKWVNRIRLQLAEAYYQAGDIKRAVYYYEKLVESGDPEIMAEVFNGLGWCYLELERFEASLQKFDVVISSYQKDTFALVSSIFGKAVSLYNSSSYLTDATERETRFVKAAYLFKEIARSFPSSPLVPSALFYAGDAFSKSGYYKNAIDEWNAVLSEYPGTKYAGFAAYWLGDTYFRAGELDKAISYFRILIEHYPDNTYTKEGYLRLASTYYTAKDYDNAVSVLKKFLGLYPDDSLSVDAKSLLEQVYYFKAEREPEKVEEYAEEFPESELLAQRLYTQAAQLYENQKYEEAIEKAKRVILLFPGSSNAAEAQKIVIGSYGALGNFKAMAEEARKFREYFPEHQDVPLMMKVEAQGLIQEEDYLKAKEVLDKLIRDFPSHTSAKEAVILKAEVLLNLGKLRECIKVLEQSSPLSGFETRYYYILGEAYNKLGNTDKAISSYSSLLQVGGMNDSYRIRGLYRLASLYELKGNLGEAANIYTAISQITTDEAIKNDALSRAQALKK